MLNSSNLHYHLSEMLFVLTLPPAADCPGQNSGEISQVISKKRLSADKLVDWSPNLIHFTLVEGAGLETLAGVEYWIF